MILVATTMSALLFAQQEPAAPEGSEAQAPEPVSYQPPPSGYRTPEQLLEDLKKRAARTDGLDLIKIGASPEGRDLLVASFVGGGAAPGSPEILIVANLEGNRLGASEVAMGMLQRIASVGSPLLKKASIHIMPLANPDGAAHALADGNPWRGAPTDDDRDGLIDEDNASDLNGDGRILWMRVPHAGGAYRIDPNDPRATAKSDSDAGEAGGYLLMREGTDADADRERNEDGPGGVVVEANFPHRWRQYAPEAGAFQLSEPESRALAGFVLQHPSISLILVLDDEDNLASPPKGKDSVDIDSTAPLSADANLLKLIGERLHPKDGEQGEVRGAEHQSGNFADWAYYQRGALVLESALWSPPLDVPLADGSDLPKNASEDHKLLAWADHWYGTYGDLGNAWQAWTPFEHPHYGAVEIGGWLPLIHENPPGALLDGLINRHADLVDSLADDLASLAWEDVEVTALDDAGVFEVRARLVNHGLMPTSTAMARVNRRLLPLRVFLELPQDAQMLAGRMRHTVEALDGLGDSRDFHWIYRLPAESEPAALRALSQSAGQATVSLEVQ